MVYEQAKQLRNVVDQQRHQLLSFRMVYLRHTPDVECGLLTAYTRCGLWFTYDRHLMWNVVYLRHISDVDCGLLTAYT